MCEDQAPKNEMAIVTVRPVRDHIGYVIGAGKVDPNITAIGGVVVSTVLITLDDHGVEILEKLIQDYKISHTPKKEHDMNEIDIKKVEELTQAFRDMTAAYKHLSKQFEDLNAKFEDLNAKFNNSVVTVKKPKRPFWDWE